MYLRLALSTPLRRLFDYLPPQDIDLTKLTPGVRIKVPFQSRTLIGILLEVVKESTVELHKLKHAYEVLDTEPVISNDIFTLCRFAADYYHHALGEILTMSLPTLLRKGKPASLRASSLSEPPEIKEAKQLELNDYQQQAVEQICQSSEHFRVFLLDGVTGSGKTEVYLRAMNQFLQTDKQILMLVPEISLTPQTISRFQARFAVPIVALHSNLSERERLQAWLKAKSGEAKIVIGTRSAIFTPFKQLGLIIIDEEHDQSFKQQDRLRYHARDLAIKRASMHDIPIVLGSATPSLESLLNAKKNRYHYLCLPERAGGAMLPKSVIVDSRQSQLSDGLSDELISMMHHHLQQNNQVLLFLNRRGFAPVLYCKACTWIAGCKRCDARLVYHQSPLRLQCHHCDAKSLLPKYCAQCGETHLQALGLGTQRLQENLDKYFPDIPIIRIDRDTTRGKNALNNLLENVHTHEKAILVGTQMLAKGHHFPRVTLVGVVDADSGLFSADFRAAEQLGQLLLQVAGRAGRADKPGTVVIQTQHPQHPLLQSLIHDGYQHFSHSLMTEREYTLMPPFAHIAVLRAKAYAEKSANDFLNQIKEIMTTFNAAEVIKILGPIPALLAKQKGMYCQNLLFKATQRSTLQSFLKKLLDNIENISSMKSVKWVLDVDPIEV